MTGRLKGRKNGTFTWIITRKLSLFKVSKRCQNKKKHTKRQNQMRSKCGLLARIGQYMSDDEASKSCCFKNYVYESDAEKKLNPAKTCKDNIICGSDPSKCNCCYYLQIEPLRYLLVISVPVILLLIIVLMSWYIYRLRQRMCYLSRECDNFSDTSRYCRCRQYN